MSLNSHVEVLIPSTIDCDLIWIRVVADGITSEDKAILE